MPSLNNNESERPTKEAAEAQQLLPIVVSIRKQTNNIKFTSILIVSIETTRLAITATWWVWWSCMQLLYIWQRQMTNGGKSIKRLDYQIVDLVFQEIMERVRTYILSIYTVILSLMNQRFINAVILDFIKFFALVLITNKIFMTSLFDTLI